MRGVWRRRRVRGGRVCAVISCSYGYSATGLRLRRGEVLLTHSGVVEEICSDPATDRPRAVLRLFADADRATVCRNITNRRPLRSCLLTLRCGFSLREMI